MSVIYDNSITAFGSVTTPAANAAIATISNAPAGIYDIEVALLYGGTTGSVETNNVEVRVDGTARFRVLLNNTASGANQPTVRRFRYRVVVNGTISVNAIAAGTAGAVYSATLAATKLSV